MRLLLLNDYATPTAGAELITLHLRDAFRAAGHETRVLASSAQLIPDHDFADASAYGSTARLQPLSAMVNPSARHALRGELESFRPDAVQVNMFMWQLSPSILPLLADVPTVHYAMDYKAICPKGTKRLRDGDVCRHGVGLPCIRERCLSGREWPSQMVQHVLWLTGRRHFDRVIAVSDAVRDRLEPVGTRVDDVVWPGVLATSAGALPDKRPTVTYAGRLVEEKGLDVLLRAFAKLPQRGLDAASLRIAGTGPAEAELKGLAHDLGLGDAVSWLGHVPQAELPGALAGAWTHAVPSTWAEPFGITGAEAMMRATPVVVSRTAGLAELVLDGESGFHVPPGDVEALAEALSRLLSDRELAVRMGAAARARVLDTSTINDCASRLLAHHQQLTDAARA